MKRFMQNFDFDVNYLGRTDKAFIILGWLLIGFVLYSLGVLWIQVILYSTFSIKLTIFQIVKGLFLISLIRFMTDWKYLSK